MLQIFYVTKAFKKCLPFTVIEDSVFTCISVTRKPKLYVAMLHASLHLLLEAKRGQ